ncbi:PXMP2/4 family protein 4 [Prorops nasuta]|uniref:PXMP2/4 family protein 4 n=1 Tax=Prorops nasuta TaxID=863751 RepID=UPI0034CEF9B6
MSISRVFVNLAHKRPLLLNSIIYGSFYTGADFAQQTFNHIFNKAKSNTRTTDGSSNEANKKSASHELQKFDQIFHSKDALLKTEQYNWDQLKRYAVYGFFLAGPILHGWYKWLDGFFQGTKPNIVIRKLIVDQFCLTPPFIILFFISMSLMEGKSDILFECRSKFVTTFTTSCIYWLPIQLMNFLFIPPAFRVTYVAIAAFCWANILCCLKSSPLPDISFSQVD